MHTPLDLVPSPFERSFTPMLAALGGGVGVVTGLLALSVDSAGVCLAMSVAATVFFAFVVLYEAGRLLADETGPS